jgi:segregation and condensation protein B
VNPDENGSLADQAAAWVPPWRRAAADEAAPTGDPVDADPAVADDFEVDDSIDDLVGFAESDLAESEAAGSEFAGSEFAGSEFAGSDAAGSASGWGDEPANVDRSDPAHQVVDVGTPVAITVRLDDAELRHVGHTEPADDADAPPPVDVNAPPPVDAVGPDTGVEAAGPADGRGESGGPDGAAPVDLRAALEAILLVVDEPVGDDALAQVLEVPTAAVEAQLEAIAAEYTAQRRGFDLRRVAGGWRLYTRGEFAPYVERFVLDGQSVRLTQAALETLAVIAYQQPVTRSRISAIRGVNCDGVVRTLMTRGLIEECGTQPESGAFLYRTTGVFLEKLGLDSVDELPPLAPFLPDDVNGLADAQR